MKKGTDTNLVVSDFDFMQSHKSNSHKNRKIKNISNKIISNDTSQKKTRFFIEDKQKQNKTELHELMKPFMVLAQCLGLMPILGINNLGSDSSVFRFQWCSVRLLISLGMAVLLITNIIFYLYAVAVGKFTFNIISELTNNVAPLIILILFLQITRRMPTLMQAWKYMEQSMCQFKTVSNVSRNTKITFYSFLFTRTALSLHSIALDLFEVYPCVNKTTLLELLKAVQVKKHFNIFSTTSWSVWKSILAIVMSVFLMYAPLLMYLFITLITILLSARFHQINYCLESIKFQVMPSNYWKIVRETYNNLSCLTKVLDYFLSSIVLFSFASSLYSLCFLLFSIEPFDSWFHMSYMIFSIIYNIVLTCKMAFSASSVYEESKRPLSVLFSVPSESYCTEVERFLAQVTSDDLALTGHKFFSVTRTLILTLAGTIVTYEIVLVQFNSVNSDSQSHTNVSQICKKLIPILNVTL